MSLPQFIEDFFDLVWAGGAQLINIALALLGSGLLIPFFEALAQAWGPLGWASAISIFLVLTEWIPKLFDNIQGNLTGGGTKAISHGTSVGSMMRMPWSKE